MNYSLKQNTGHTLLETIVYIAILVALLVVVVNTLIVVSRAYGTVSATRSLNRNAMASIDRVLHEVRGATLLVPTKSNLGIDPSVLTLQKETGEVRFALVDGVLEVAREGEEPEALTGSDVVVTSFVLEQVTTGSGEGVKATLSLQSGSGNHLSSETFYAAALLRGAYQ